MRSLWPGLVVLAGVSWTVPVHAELPASYRFEIQARAIAIDSGVEPFNVPRETSLHDRSPSLNDMAAVAIGVASTPVDTSTSQAIWTGGRGTGEIVHTGTITPAPDAGFDEIRITNSGRVYWVENPRTDDPAGIYYADPDGSRELLTVKPTGTSYYSSMQVNGEDQIAVLADLGGSRTIGVLDVDAPDSVTTYLSDDKEDPTSDYTALIPSIGFNDDAAVAAEAWLDGIESVHRINGSSDHTQLVAEGDSVIGGTVVSGIANGAAINDAGQVAIIVFGKDTKAVLRIEADDTVTEIVSTGDPEVSDVGNFAPVINDGGVVAFRAVDADGEDAIFIGDGTMLRRVVRETDAVEADLGTARIGNEDEGTDWTAFSGNIDINADGDIAFVANLYPDGMRDVEWGHGLFVAHALPSCEEDGDCDDGRTCTEDTCEGEVCSFREVTRGACEPDAGTPVDAGLGDAGASDAGRRRPDGGASDGGERSDAMAGAGSGDGGGCGCRTPAGQGSRGGAGVLVLAFGLMIRGRRRRRA